MDPRARERNVVDALTSAVESLGLTAHPGTDADDADVVLVLPEGRQLRIQLKSAALITADSLVGQLRRWSADSPVSVGRVVVANRITAEARNNLNHAGWGWLDRRGHLRLTGPGVFIDADVPATVGPTVERRAISGQVGVELAALLLLDPARRVGIRGAAKTLSRAPSSVSEALAGLRAAGLVDEDNKPVVPSLFWELVESWRPPSRDLASIPPVAAVDSGALRLGMEDVESTVGWALTDTLAAAAYGAPVSVRTTHPPDLYVPDETTLRRAVQLLGTATTATSRAGRVRVAPVPMVCSRRIDATAWSNQEWPLAHPLFVALDLAQDPDRGREVLDGWTPRGAGTRVW